MTTIDFLNMTGGVPDDTWVDADFATIETAIDAWWTGMKIFFPSWITLDELRWYRIGPSIVPPNPAVRVTDRNVAATGSATGLPPQVAVTVTEKTAVRKEWGRIYLPNLITTKVQSGTGRIDPTTQQAILDLTTTLYDDAATADFLPVVYSRTRRKTYGIEKLQVDDIFDVQRPRRWDRPISRLVGTVGP